MIGVEKSMKQAGFTLMEMTVALGLFAIIMTSATDIYLMAGRTQRRALSTERVQSDIRFVLEAITREVRGGSIDYEYYASRGEPIQYPEDELALVASDGSRIRFSASGTGQSSYCVDLQSLPCLLVTIDGGTPAPMTSRGTSVSGLRFYIAPATDPFDFDPDTGSYGPDQQPIVTTSLYVRSVDGRAGEQALVNLQTTAASRQYRR